MEKIWDNFSIIEFKKIVKTVENFFQGILRNKMEHKLIQQQQFQTKLATKKNRLKTKQRKAIIQR